MKQLAHTEEHAGHTINIFFDEDAQNPRMDWEPFATMVCFHNRYNLGDEHSFSEPSEFEKDLAMEVDTSVEDRWYYWDDHPSLNWEQIEKRQKDLIQKALDKHVVMLPLYLYDHGGITMSTTPFGCRWDSGQVGWIYVTREVALKEFGGKIFSKQLKAKVLNLLEGEVKTYDQYLTGDVYGYTVEGEHCDDSCWGFFGDDFSQMIDEAKRSIDFNVERFFDTKKKLLIDYNLMKKEGHHGKNVDLREIALPI